MTERDLEILLHKAFTCGGMYAIHSNRGDEAMGAPAQAPMSPDNRLIAYKAASRLRELGFEWDFVAEEWLQPINIHKGE